MNNHTQSNNTYKSRPYDPYDYMYIPAEKYFEYKEAKPMFQPKVNVYAL